MFVYIIVESGGEKEDTSSVKLFGGGFQDI